jgi:quinolinate synthase
VQDIADIVGDSFEMAKRAHEAKENLIVICGVRFMGESAKILSPDKKVLVAAADAGCPMAEMVTVDDVVRLKAEHPDAVVMCYVNSVGRPSKPVSDICCTVVVGAGYRHSLDARKIIFVPDIHLAEYTAGRSPTRIHPSHGFLPDATTALPRRIFWLQKKRIPTQNLRAPECRAEVLKHADFIEAPRRSAFLPAKPTRGRFSWAPSLNCGEAASDVPDKKFYTR